MSNGSKDRRKDSRALRDPAGIIEQHAKELWEEAGRPTDRTWQDYWDMAEKNLLAGRGSGTRVEKQKKKESKPLSTRSGARPFTEDRNPVLALVAQLVGADLEEHECVGLAFLLRQHEIQLTDGVSQGPFNPSMVSDLLAVLAADNLYPPDLSADEERRAAFWRERIEDVEAEDRALTYSARNTIDRLKDRIQGDPRIAEIRYAGK